MMNRFKCCIASSAVLLGASSLAIASPSINTDFQKIKAFFTQPHKHKKNHVDLLFLQQADAGSLVKLPGRNKCYRLTLSNLHENVLYFTDQPKRKAGNITNAEFMQVWKHNTIIPNVAIQAFTVSPDDVRNLSLITTLKRPHYNTKNQTVTYTACSIQKDKENLSVKKATLRSVNLFIDPLHQWPP